MRITDLLDKNSICLDASPADKTEALNQIVSLMGKSGKINDIEAYRKQVFFVKRRARPELVRALRFHMVNAMQLQSRDLQQW